MAVNGQVKRSSNTMPSKSSHRCYGKDSPFRISYFIVLLLIGLLSEPALTQDLTSAPVPAPGSSGDSTSSSSSGNADPLASATAAPLGGGGGEGTGLENAYPMSSEPTSSTEGKCRDRLGWFSPEEFSMWACGQCVGYIYQMSKTKATHVVFHEKVKILILLNSTGQYKDFVLPDVNNATYVVEKVCPVMESDGIECQRWISCCKSAEQCCQNQLAAQAAVTAATGGGAGGGDDSSPGYCPATWDGFGCWEAAVAGTTVSTSCPGYVAEHASDGVPAL